MGLQNTTNMQDACEQSDVFAFRNRNDRGPKTARHPNMRGMPGRHGARPLVSARHAAGTCCAGCFATVILLQACRNQKVRTRWVTACHLTRVRKEKRHSQLIRFSRSAARPLVQNRPHSTAGLPHRTSQANGTPAGKACVNGSYACQDFLFDSLSLSLKDFAGPSPPARIAGTCLPSTREMH